MFPVSELGPACPRQIVNLTLKTDAISTDTVQVTESDQQQVAASTSRGEERLTEGLDANTSAQLDPEAVNLCMCVFKSSFCFRTSDMTSYYMCKIRFLPKTCKRYYRL